MNAYQLKALQDLGITVGELGCVMLDVESPKPIAGLIPESWAYHSKHSDLQHVSGIQTEHHVTLLFGLLAGVRRAHVDEVLEGWTGLDVSVKTDSIDVFPSPIPDEPYSCIVARQLRRAFRARDSYVPILFRPAGLNYGSTIGRGA